MNYSDRVELVKALNDKFNEPVGNDGNTRYDANTGTIYSNTGNYTVKDVDEARVKLAEFSKKCTSINSTITLNPSYVRYCSMIDAILLLCKEQMEGKKDGVLK